MIKGKGWRDMTVLWGKVMMHVGRWRVLSRDAHPRLLDPNVENCLEMSHVDFDFITRMLLGGLQEEKTLLKQAFLWSRRIIRPPLSLLNVLHLCWVLRGLVWM